jgi:nitrogen fixation protein FixH
LILVAFFALVIAVDAYFIVRAVATFPGEQVKNSYVLGLDYNHEVERRDRQRELGWRAEAGIVETGGQHLLVHLKSGAAEPLSGLTVSAQVFSAAIGGIDETIELKEREAGSYVAAVSLPSRAHVEVRISASRAGDAEPAFEAIKTLVIS